jgi:hypothetical protein
MEKKMDEVIIVEAVNPTPEEMLDEVMHSYVDVAREKGIDETFLAQRGKAELNAKYVKHIKVKGRIEDETTIPANYKVIGVFRDVEGNIETLLQFSGRDMPIRQRARESHNKLYGHQPEPSIIRNQFQTIVFQSMMPEPDPPPDEDDPNACISGAEHLIDVES